MYQTVKFGDTCPPVTCHAWNKDRSQIAFSPNNNEVRIYQKAGKDWKQTHNLVEHDLKVKGIDWAPNTNRIVTCSEDRNAYVWTKEADGSWSKVLVILRINRAATCIKWSPLENKFAVGAAAGLIAICYFEKENNWWVSKHINMKPVRATVTTIDWNINNILLAAGSADFRVRILSTYVKEIEEKPGPNVWGSKLPFGQVLAETPNSKYGGGWIHSVSFSGDGNKVAWVAHDSSINVIDATQNRSVIKLKTTYLPFLQCTWISNKSIIVAGHDCVPLLYSYEGDQIKFLTKLGDSEKKQAAGVSAMMKFRTMERQACVETNDTQIDSVHQNAITSISIFEGTKDATWKLGTFGLDGQLVIWDLVTLEKSVKGLKIV